MAAENLRDSRQLIDVALLDAKVAATYGSGSIEERTAAEQIFHDLHNNPYVWHQVKHILQNTKNLNTKCFTLQVLEGVIKYQWNALPVEQRAEMKHSISCAILQISSNEASFRIERLHVNKLNVILVQILKHEWQVWQVRWQSNIANLVAAAKTSETMCENCMAILKLLSEEVFNFSRPMIQQKITDLKRSLNSEFQHIHELCLYALSESQRTELIRATLSTLHAFLSWIPFDCIFESTLLDTLLKFFPVPAYRNLALQCLTKVAALNFGDLYNVQYIKMYNSFMVQLQAILPPTMNISEVYAHGISEEQAFIQNLALFFTSVYKFHIQELEVTQENITALVMGLEYLNNISYVDDGEVFKVCLDCWNSLVLALFEAHHNLDNPAVAAANMMGLQRRQLFPILMSKLRMLMICRMAKPEGVLMVEDENGNIVRETMDNDVLIRYKVLEEFIKCRWNALPLQQRDEMKNYISNAILQLSRNEAYFQTERLYVNKLNDILVQILKHEWPVRCFIPNLVAVAKTSETICENSMAILKLLSEEVSDFSRREMTEREIIDLNSEFQLILELCLYALSRSQRNELICATLSTLHAFLPWIPFDCIFESTLLDTLLKFFPVPAYRNLALQCLIEVAALNFGDFYNAQYIRMYNSFMAQLQVILPPTTNLSGAYPHGSSEEQAFIQNLALFFTSFYKFHIRVLETTQENITALVMGLQYLNNISYVEDTKVSKVCSDYLNSLVMPLFEARHNLDNPAVAVANMMGQQLLQTF